MEEQQTWKIGCAISSLLLIGLSGLSIFHCDPHDRREMRTLKLFNCRSFIMNFLRQRSRFLYLSSVLPAIAVGCGVACHAHKTGAAASAASTSAVTLSAETSANESWFNGATVRAVVAASIMLLRRLRHCRVATRV